MRLKKFRIEVGIVLALAGCIMIAFACSKQPIAPQIVNPYMIQAEAKWTLMQIYEKELAYQDQYDSFWLSNEVASATNPLAFAPLGLELSSANRYSYVVYSEAPGSFIGMAAYGLLDDDASQDLWRIDHTGSLVVLSDDTRM